MFSRCFDGISNLCANCYTDYYFDNQKFWDFDESLKVSDAVNIIDQVIKNNDETNKENHPVDDNDTASRVNDVKCKIATSLKNLYDAVEEVNSVASELSGVGVP